MMLRSRVALTALAVLAAVGSLIFVLRDRTPDSPATFQLNDVSSGAPQAVFVPPAPRHAPLGLPQLELRPLVALLPDPMIDPGRKWRALNAVDDPFARQMLAVNSGDPVLLYGAVKGMLHCSSTAVLYHGKDVRQVMTEFNRDPTTGSSTPVNEDFVLMSEALSTLGPQRMFPIAEIRAEIARAVAATSPSRAQPGPALTKEHYLRNAAPLTAYERATYDQIVAKSRAECAGRTMSEGFGPAWRGAIDRLVAQGVTSAQLFNSRAGWQGKTYDRDLTPRDFDLLERAFLDARPDTWARLLLLSPRATGQPPPDLWPDDLAMLGPYMSLDLLLGPLTACALGVYDCSPNSTYFQAYCMDYGGCDQTDLAALMRHIFQRDGLDPGIVDREIGRVVTMYRYRDFAALGFRRK